MTARKLYLILILITLCITLIYVWMVILRNDASKVSVVHNSAESELETNTKYGSLELSAAKDFSSQLLKTPPLAQPPQDDVDATRGINSIQSSFSSHTAILGTTPSPQASENETKHSEPKISSPVESKGVTSEHLSAMIPTATESSYLGGTLPISSDTGNMVATVSKISNSTFKDIVHKPSKSSYLGGTRAPNSTHLVNIGSSASKFHSALNTSKTSDHLLNAGPFVSRPVDSAISPGLVSNSHQSKELTSNATQLAPAVSTNVSETYMGAEEPRTNYPTSYEMSMNFTNPHPFKYLIAEDDFCSRRYKNLFMLIYIHTAPGNFELRNAIRETWGSKTLYPLLHVATVFVLGETSDKTIDARIKVESEEHHDIIQEDFLDSYRNLSYKGVAALRWITHFCQEPQFILKVDDDMLVNTFAIVRFLKKIWKQNPNFSQFMCLFYNNNMPVVRDKASKWYMSEKDYQGDFYLPYCSGSAFIFPTSIAPKLYDVSFDTPFLWVDDVYITGLLARSAGITHTSIEQFYDLYKSREELVSNIVYGNKIFGHFNFKPTPSIEWYREFWKNITDTYQ